MAQVGSNFQKGGLVPRTLPGRRDPALGPGPAPAVVTGEASSWARSSSQPHSPLLGAPCLGFPVCPIHPSFRAGSSGGGTHTCRVCSGGPVSALRAAWGGPRDAAAGGSGSPPRADRDMLLGADVSAQPATGAPPSARGVTRAPTAPVRGLLDSAMWPRALSGSETGTTASSLAPQAPPLCPPRALHAQPSGAALRA